MITVTYENIDDWNRPIFRSIKSNIRFGSLNILFPYQESEEVVLNQVESRHLEYFGRSFNCEPMGGIEPVEIITNKEALRYKNEI